MCHQIGGYLAEVRTSSQLSLLSGLAGMEEEFYGIQNWWIGLSDLGHEGTSYQVREVEACHVVSAFFSGSEGDVLVPRQPQREARERAGLWLRSSC